MGHFAAGQTWETLDCYGMVITFDRFLGEMRIEPRKGRRVHCRGIVWWGGWRRLALSSDDRCTRVPRIMTRSGLSRRGGEGAKRC